MNWCERCERNEAKVHLKMEATSMHLCTNCYNQLMAEELEVDLDQLLESFAMKDGQGVSRTFYVERRVNPIGIYLEAVENIEFGYKFAVHGELKSNQQELLSKLMEKVRKGIREQQVETGVFPNGQEYNTVINDQLKGLIEYDASSEGTPLVINTGACHHPNFVED
ncbi:DUF7686 domain-containing protein [Neobacillus sp. 19]|uniref:DUF7686 domain-containing protein n=1 Tax=Neobacillus sp. 19 TaxID=3394458 RepID=UPI003BF6E4E7